MSESVKMETGVVWVGPNMPLEGLSPFGSLPSITRSSFATEGRDRPAPMAAPPAAGAKAHSQTCVSRPHRRQVPATRHMVRLIDCSSGGDWIGRVSIKIERGV